MKIKKSLASILGAVSLGLTRLASATDYYVSPKGNDANRGTQQEPWQTVEKVSGADLRGKDKVLFEANQIFEGTLNTKFSGMTGAPIIFTSYGNGKAKIINSKTKKPSIWLSSNSFLTFYNLELNSPDNRGIVLSGSGSGSSDIIFENLNISNCSLDGLNGANPEDKNITLENCTFENNGGVAVEFHGKSITLKGNHIKGNGVKPAIGLYGVQKAVIEDNEISTAVAPKPIFIEMDRKPAFYIADRNKWLLPRQMYEGFVVNKKPMSLSEFKRYTGQHAGDNRPGAGPTSALPTPPGYANPQTPVQPSYQTPQTNAPSVQSGYQNLTPFQRWQLMQKGKR